jgi:hypothetical protein
MGISCDESDGLKRAANSSGSPVANEIAVAPAPTFQIEAGADADPFQPLLDIRYSLNHD